MAPPGDATEREAASAGVTATTVAPGIVSLFTSHKFRFASSTRKPHKGTSWHSCTGTTTMSNGSNGNGLAELERRLSAAADRLGANSSLRLPVANGGQT
jgi:hypothetical protein